MGQWVKLQLSMLASNTGVLFQVLAAPLPTQFPGLASGKVALDGSDTLDQPRSHLCDNLLSEPHLSPSFPCSLLYCL